MSEPTLGRRIMDAAMRWAFDRALCGIEVGRESEDQLRALCARADAAERGMVAASAYWGAIDAYDTSENSAEWEDLLEAMDRSREDLDNALAAWRAINGEVDSD